MLQSGSICKREPKGKSEPDVFFREEKCIEMLGTKVALIKMRAEVSLGSLY